MAKSSIERVRKHLKMKGSRTPAPAELHDDLEHIVRRCDSIRDLGDVYASIQMSPYMKSLLRVTSFEAAHATGTVVAAEPTVAASL